jgi:hypothetical protein
MLNSGLAESGKPPRQCWKLSVSTIAPNFRAADIAVNSEAPFLEDVRSRDMSYFAQYYAREPTNLLMHQKAFGHGRKPCAN